MACFHAFGNGVWRITKVVALHFVKWIVEITN